MSKYLLYQARYRQLSGYYQNRTATSLLNLCVVLEYCLLLLSFLHYRWCTWLYQEDDTNLYRYDAHEIKWRINKYANNSRCISEFAPPNQITC